MTIMIGIDPHKATHTAVAIDGDEHVLDEFTLRSSNVQVRRLRAWAGQFNEPVWAVESALKGPRIRPDWFSGGWCGVPGRGLLRGV